MFYSSVDVSVALMGCLAIDKISRLLWAWYSCSRKSAVKIGEPWHMADIFVCCFMWSLPAQQQNSDCKMLLVLLFLHLMNKS